MCMLRVVERIHVSNTSKELGNIAITIFISGSVIFVPFLRFLPAL